MCLDSADLRTTDGSGRRRITVPQETARLRVFRARDGRHGAVSPGPVRERRLADLAIAREALRTTGTLHLESRLFGTLSGGEKQRVVIAGALAQFGLRDRSRPDATEVLMLDEPTASLDLAYQLEIRSILHELNRDSNLTIVISTHDLNLAAGLCSHLILLDRGRVLAAGPAETLLKPALIQQLYGVEVDITTHPRTAASPSCGARATTAAERRRTMVSPRRTTDAEWKGPASNHDRRP